MNGWTGVGVIAPVLPPVVRQGKFTHEKEERMAEYIEPPRTVGGRSDDIQLWERTGNGDIWKGFFVDAKTGLDWIRAHPGNYVLNNVRPSADRDPVRGNVHRTEPAPKPVRAKASAPKPFAPRRAAAKVTSYKPQSKEAKALVAQARDRLSQHKRDEAEELKAKEA